jgi:2-oxoisovalerate dehydrogenase E1 component
LENVITASVEKIAAAARAVIEGRPPIPLRAVGLSQKAAAQPLPEGAGRALPAVPVAAAAAPPAPKPPATAAQDGVPVLVPNMDLIITEATVVAWLKKPGEPVRQGEAIVELETDKAVTQVESPADGVLAEILAAEGTVIALGGRLGTVRP